MPREEYTKAAMVPLLLDAWISEDERYRYTLRRTIRTTRHARGPVRYLAWVMLNPSKADALDDDPTIRKVRGFTDRAGYDAFYVVNLFAFRETKPTLLRAVVRERGFQYVEGPNNRDAIQAVVGVCEAVVCAWGATPFAKESGLSTLAFLRALRKPLLCLGRTKDGAPLHPLMPGYDDHPFVPYAVERAA